MTDARSVARVAIVGAGISGLAAANRLLEISTERGVPIEAVVLEASDRFGGVISTIRRDGFLLEEGPDSILTEKPWAHELAARIGLSEHLIPTLATHRRSFVVCKGRLEAAPVGFQLVAPARIGPVLRSRIFSPLGKLRMGLDLILPKRPPAGDESVAAFVRRRLGREVLERIAEPMIAGIYGADPEALSARATIPRFLAMEQAHGSIIRAMLAARSAGGDRAGGARYGLFVTLDTGLQSLTEALASRLPASWVRLGARVSRLSPRSGSGWILHAGRSEETFDAVVLALPAHAAADLTETFDADLARMLASIDYGSAVTVSLGFRSRDIRHPMDGFGFVAPAIERMGILGCTFGHMKYAGRAPEGHALLRVFMGGEMIARTDEQIAQRALVPLRTLLGIAVPPIFAHVARWPRAMARYAVGHLDLVERIEERLGTHPGLALAGNAYRGIGIPDCVRSAEAAAQHIAAELFASPS